MIFRNSTVQEIEFEEIIDFYLNYLQHQIPAKTFSLKVSQKNSQSKTQQRVPDFVYGNCCASQMPRTHLVTMNKYRGLKQMSHFGPKNRGRF